MIFSHGDQGPRSASEMNVVPARVRSAQDFLHFAQNVRCIAFNARAGHLPGDAPQGEVEMPKLDKKEQAVYDSALMVLQQYFNGEMDYGDQPPTSPNRGPDDEEPKKPEPVPA